MKKFTSTILTILILTLTACSGARNSAEPASATQNGFAAGALPLGTQLAIGILKLDGTANAITTEQAKELLPLWETLQVLYGSNTAAEQEIEALTTQIQETMSTQQTAAITAMNLTRQDMSTVMQERGISFGNGFQNSSQTNGSTNRNNNSGGFGPGGFVPGAGGPPEGGFVPGGFQGGGQGTNRNQGTGTQTTGSGTEANGQFTRSLNRIPTPLVQALIEYLKGLKGQ